MKRTLAAVAATLAASLSPAAAADGPAPPAPGRTLEVWSMFQKSEPLARWMEALAAGFEAANPGAKVEISWKGRQILTAARGAIQERKPPDLIDQDDQTLIQLAKEGVLEPLDDAMNAVDDGVPQPPPSLPATPARSWRQAFEPAALELARHDGRICLWPRSLYTSGFFCHKAALEKAGMAAPATWAGFLKLGEALKAAGTTPIAADGTIDFYNDWYFSWLAIRIAGPEKYLKAAKNEGVAWDDPDFRKAAEGVETLVKGGFFQKAYEGSPFPRAQQGWIEGEEAMILCGAWLPKEMEPAILDIEKEKPGSIALEMFPFPEVEGGKGGFDVAEAWFNGWAVPKDAANKDLAIRFLQFATTEANVKALVAAGDPAAVAGAGQPRFLDAQSRIFARAKAFVPQKGGIGRDAPEWMKRVLQPANNKLFKGELGAGAFIEELKRTHEAFYAAKSDAGK